MSSGDTRKRVQEILESPLRPKKSRSSGPSSTSTTRLTFSNTTSNTPNTTVEEDIEIGNVISGSTASADEGISSSTLAGHSYAIGHQSLNPQSLAISVPETNEVFQMVIQEYIDKLSDDDKRAFQSATDVMDKLGGALQQGKSRITGSHTTRMQKVQKVMRCVKQFLVSIAMCIQHHPEIFSLVVGGLNCILTVSIY